MPRARAFAAMKQTKIDVKASMIKNEYTSTFILLIMRKILENAKRVDLFKIYCLFSSKTF